MSDPRETLACIRAQAGAATEGPWEVSMDRVERTGGGEYAVAYDVAREEDAEFIAAARTTVPALLDLADAVLKRHAPMPIYVLAEDCEAPDDHQHGSTPDGGDEICWDEPTGDVHCRECRDKWGDRVEHPCPTFADVTAVITALEGGTHD